MGDNSRTLATQLVRTYVEAPTRENRDDLTRLVMDGPQDLRSDTLEALFSTLDRQAHELDSLTRPPHALAVVCSAEGYRRDGDAPLALVRMLPHGKQALCPVACREPLHTGDLVALSGDPGSVLDRLGSHRGSSIARVDRVLPDTDEVVVSGPGEDHMVLIVGEGLRGDGQLRPGCEVRFCAETLVATRVESTREERSDALAEDIGADLDWCHVGGYAAVRRELQRIEEMMLAPDEELAAYGLGERTAKVLLAGPPGTGKTHVARVLAARLRRSLGDDAVTLVIVRANQLLHWLVGRSEANIRDLFDRVEALAKRGRFVVVVWDEIESMFPSRGSRYGGSGVEDRVTTEFLTRLDGLVPLRRTLFVGTTNRPDLLDSAAVRSGRLGELIQFPPPDLADTREIFRIHLSGRASAKGWSSDALAERAAAAVFAPQHDGTPVVARVRFGDGRREPIRRPDLVSGALIADACRAAAASAWSRDRSGGTPGITAEDVRGSLERAFTSIASRLKPGNLKDYVDWPLDDLARVVAVEPERHGTQAAWRSSPALPRSERVTS